LIGAAARHGRRSEYFACAGLFFFHETVNFGCCCGLFRLAQKNRPPYIPRIGLNSMMLRHLE
jgi:hypothetical protein